MATSSINNAAAPAPVQPDPSLIAGGPTVVSIKGKKARLTGAELKARTADARRMTGYGATSPIFGKLLPVVLGDIEGFLLQADAQAAAGNSSASRAEIDRAITFLRELNKRIATRKIAFAR